MSSKRSLTQGAPPVFTSDIVRAADGNTRVLYNQDKEALKSSGIIKNTAFRYDQPGTGLRSTQQISLDYEGLENHVFFNSAVASVNVAFNKIINLYPFDGSDAERIEFLDGLTGYEKYIFDKFPTNKGYLFFSGSTHGGSLEGSHIKVVDFAGSTFPTLSKRADGDNILDPLNKSITFEMELFVPAIANSNQVLLQKLSGTTKGITLGLSQSSSTSACNILFAITSGSEARLHTSASIVKGRFNHICATFNRKSGNNFLEIFVNTERLATSSTSYGMGNIDFQVSPLMIGSGTTHRHMGPNYTTLDFTPTQTFSGALDELRIFHSNRTKETQKKFKNKNIFATEDLKLYFKFNEPTGTLGQRSNIVLDSSGNSLHSLVSNFTHNLRNTSSIASPLKDEKDEFNPVLFPGFNRVHLLNMRLLNSGTSYDEENPNLITKLVPKHYFEEGKAFFGFENEEGTITGSIGGSSIPGSAELGTEQILSSFLYVWAKLFDEMKIYTDQLSKVKTVSYDREDSIADHLLPSLVDHYGVTIPNFFSDSDPAQFYQGEDLKDIAGYSSKSLQFVKNEITRRILTNFRDAIRSKGTLHAVKSLIRSMGIDPDSNFRIREFGGPTQRKIKQFRKRKTETSTLLTFTGSLASTVDKTSVDLRGINPKMPFVQSPFLSGSRIEVGNPLNKGVMVNKGTPNGVHGISNASSDGLFTSGSWTYEGIYKFENITSTGSVASHPTTQSLARLNVSGAISNANSYGLIFNLLAVTGSENTGVRLFGRPSFGTTSTTIYPALDLELSGVDIFDGQKWSVSFGRSRNDLTGSVVSSSYFLRCAKQDNGRIVNYYATSSFYLEDPTGSFGNVVLQTLSNNSSGSFFTIGSQSLDLGAGYYLNTRNVKPLANQTDFTGKVGHIRFWSKSLEAEEWKEHVRNFKSLGVFNPLVNFNFETSPTGSFERLRIDASTDQVLTSALADGSRKIFDFSQNNLHLTGTGFASGSGIIFPETFYYSHISPRFDEAETDVKVRARGYSQKQNVKEFDVEFAPIYKLQPSLEPTDDPRFTIDFSIADAVDEDIINIFATLQEIENAIGDPELMFAPDYPGLTNLRDVYFNRLTQKINNKEFFEFYKWFDGAIGNMIEDLLPKKTRFQGINFVIESHILERPKFEYLFNDHYLGDNNRSDLKGKILLQQFVASMKKF